MSDELKPCPFCGGEPSTNDGGNSVYGRFWWAVGCVECDVIFRDKEKWDANRPGYLDPKYPPKHCFTLWNTRAPLSVQEAAKVLLNDDEACLRLAEAYDREDGAQRGDPSPHALGRDEPDYAEWAQDRVGCAKAALRAIAEGGEA